MQRKEITLELIVADVLDSWPQVIPVFLKHQMSCVGCSMAAFEVLADALRIYGISADQFMDEMNSAVTESKSRGAP